MTEKLEDRIGRCLRKSIMTDDECRASYEIDRVLDACNTENESMLVRKLLRLVDLYEVDGMLYRRMAILMKLCMQNTPLITELLSIDLTPA